MRILAALLLGLCGCGAKGPPRAPGAKEPPAMFAEPDPSAWITEPQPGLEAGGGYGGAGGADDGVVPEAVPRADEPEAGSGPESP